MQIFKLFGQTLNMLDRCTWNSRIDWRFQNLDFNLRNQLSTFLMRGFWGLCLSSAETTIAVETPMALEEFSPECKVLSGEEYCWRSSVPAGMEQVARMIIMSPMKAREQLGMQEWFM
jgi:hypothetical protein